MPIPDWITTAIAALGGGGGIALLVRSFRSRALADADRESPVPQERCADRGVTHAELAAALATQRAEMNARIEQAEADCERRTQEAAERTAAQLDRLAGQIGTANERIAHVVGLLEGLRDRQIQSRRGR